jgi:hypothetical protein
MIRKEKFVGVWINHDREIYEVDFYNIASSKPLSDINKSALLQGLDW